MSLRRRPLGASGRDQSTTTLRLRKLPCACCGRRAWIVVGPPRCTSCAPAPARPDRSATGARGPANAGVDPLMAVLDRLPVEDREPTAAPPRGAGGRMPFGLHFAVEPLPVCAGNDPTCVPEKYIEATRVTRDGRTDVLDDLRERMRRD